MPVPAIRHSRRSLERSPVPIGLVHASLASYVRPHRARSMETTMAEPDKALRRSARKMRCAVYTRKSSEEGLEQAFNSLDAQREACEAYIRSQRHEGWVFLPQAYDDGGLSGATMDRPALQQLLADIQAGDVDVVVTYKVDR